MSVAVLTGTQRTAQSNCGPVGREQSSKILVIPITTVARRMRAVCQRDFRITQVRHAQRKSNTPHGKVKIHKSCIIKRCIWNYIILLANVTSPQFNFFKSKESILFIFLINSCFFSPLLDTTLITPPHTITTLLSLSTSPFCSIPPPPNRPPTNCHLLSIYESVPIFLVSSVCSLDPTYEWDHMVFVSVWLAYFT